MSKPLNFSVDYSFWPVGQGLFASGVLKDTNGVRRFHWVYDCGTTSAQKYIKTAIKTYQTNNFNGVAKPKIDLVVISHFDKDHISGIVDLLSKFSVKTLLLPHMPLWQRLLIAFANGVDSQQSVMRLFVDPVGFINAAAGEDRVGQIVFVPPSGEGPPDAEGNPIGGDDGFLLRGRFREVNQNDPEEQSLEIPPPGATNSTRPQVQFLESQSSLNVGGIWEFVPYNDASIKIKASAVSISDFQKEVAKNRDKLLASPSDAVLGDLKDLYDLRFGKTGLARNLISLFMYAGPAYPRAASSQNWASVVLASGSITRDVWLRWSARLAVLYTGDGYLNSTGRFDALTNYLTKMRISRVSCFQVMHHGAQGNWHEGIAKKVSPDISVFSSDPDHKGLNHPHGCVARDFLKYTPVQVDKTDGLKILMRQYS